MNLENQCRNQTEEPHLLKVLPLLLSAGIYILTALPVRANGFEKIVGCIDVTCFYDGETGEKIVNSELGIYNSNTGEFTPNISGSVKLQLRYSVIGTPGKDFVYKHGNNPIKTEIIDKKGVGIYEISLVLQKGSTIKLPQVAVNFQKWNMVCTEHNGTCNNCSKVKEYFTNESTTIYPTGVVINPSLQTNI